MNPIGSVAGQESCGCPNTYIDEGYGGVQGAACSMLPGYQSVFDSMTVISPSETPSAAAPAPVSAPTMIAPAAPASAPTATAPAPATSATQATSGAQAQAQCYNNDNRPNTLLYGPWPMQAGMGTPFDGLVPSNPLGGSVMENVASGLDKVTTNLKNLVGLGNGTAEWIRGMRNRYFSSAPSTGDATQDEANFQRWLTQIKEKFAEFQQSQQMQQQQRQIASGAAVGEAGSWTRTIVWIALIAAIAGLIFWKRDSVKKTLGFSTTATTRDDLDLFTPRETASGASAHWRSRHSGRGRRVPF